MVRPIILASRSPRRMYLLKKHRIPFKIRVSHVSEKTSKKYPPAVVKELSLRKARAVAGKLKKGLVMGADTIVVKKGKIIGKPRNRKHAMYILRLLNGSVNYVYTAIAFIDAATGKEWVDFEKSKVIMRNLPDKRLKIFAKKHFDKAGAYAVQEKNDAFVKKVIGDYTNVVGLPIPLLKQMLKKI